jgi:alkylhydroperoxidase family enzyme
MPRIPYVDEDDLPDEYQVLQKREDALPEEINAEFWNEQPTVLTFSNNPELGHAHVTMNTELWAETGLSAGEVECVILTIARTLESDYEWHDHVIAALERAGLSKQTVLAISNQDPTELDDVHSALSRYATEFVKKDGSVTEETHNEVANHFNDETIAGLAILAGYYVSLVYILRALDITLEEPFVGWKLENYPVSEP